MNIVQDVKEGTLWVNKEIDTDHLRVEKVYPHKYLPNKAKVDVLIKTLNDEYAENFSMEYLLTTFKRVM